MKAQANQEGLKGKAPIQAIAHSHIKANALAPVFKDEDGAILENVILLAVLIDDRKSPWTAPKGDRGVVYRTQIGKQYGKTKTPVVVPSKDGKPYTWFDSGMDVKVSAEFSMTTTSEYGLKRVAEMVESVPEVKKVEKKAKTATNQDENERW